MYHVVMGVGPEDEQVTEKAGAIAALPEAPERVRVTVVHATADPESARDVESVRRARDHFENADIDCDVVGVDASPTDAVLETAATEDADLVCVGGRRRSPAGKLQLKSGAQTVILRADRPVLVAGDVE